jgi:ubiquitin-conjugating enzyme (huntingtin interacting protein 2)
MLLENPNPKDPQDAEVAKMMLDDPEKFAIVAHDWAVKYAGATRRELDLSRYKKDTPISQMVDSSRYVTDS